MQTGHLHPGFSSRLGALICTVLMGQRKHREEMELTSPGALTAKKTLFYGPPKHQRGRILTCNTTGPSFHSASSSPLNQHRSAVKTSCYKSRVTYHNRNHNASLTRKPVIKGLHVILIYDEVLNSGLRIAPESCHSAGVEPAELTAASLPAPGEKQGRSDTCRAL